MGWPRRLVFVRHGESEGNVLTTDQRAGFCLATHEYPLTPKGRMQAAITGAYLRERFPEGFDAVYHSYYRRAKQTAQIAFPNRRLYEDPRLAEAQRGIWHTMTKEEILQYFPKEVERKEREGLYHYRPLGGENWPDVELRIHSLLGTFSRDYDGKNLAVFGHGNWFILLQRLIQRFSINEALRRYREEIIDNASVSVYEGVMEGGKSRLVLREENIVPWKGKISTVT